MTGSQPARPGQAKPDHPDPGTPYTGREETHWIIYNSHEAMAATERLRIAVVTQRYGQEIVGGESLCFQVMARLQARLDITVLTTCASDYQTWKNEYPPGTTQEGDIRVLRFPVRHERWPPLFREVNRFASSKRRLRSRLLTDNRFGRELDRIWVDLQGPYCPDLARHIAAHQNEFDAFLFYTYLYYPTIRGIGLAGDKAILVPFAHDEPPIYLKLFDTVFAAARAFMFMTVDEKDFVAARFGLGDRAWRIASMRIPTLDDLTGDQAISEDALAAFRFKYGLDAPFFLYAGRVEVAKGSDWLFSRFLEYTSRTGRSVLLVMIGKAHVPIPDHPQIRFLGYLSEREKVCAMRACEAFIQPSEYESLSITTLEALGMGKPAIVNAGSPVLAAHIRTSGAGFAVKSNEEFEVAADAILNGQALELGVRGYRYVRDRTGWENIETAYLEMIGHVSSTNARTVRDESGAR